MAILYLCQLFQIFFLITLSSTYPLPLVESNKVCLIIHNSIRGLVSKCNRKKNENERKKIIQKIIQLDGKTIYNTLIFFFPKYKLYITLNKILLACCKYFFPDEKCINDHHYAYLVFVFYLTFLIFMTCHYFCPSY